MPGPKPHGRKKYQRTRVTTAHVHRGLAEAGKCWSFDLQFVCFQHVPTCSNQKNQSFYQTDRWNMINMMTWFRFWDDLNKKINVSQALPPQKRLQLLPEDVVREMIQCYDGPENILSQTGPGLLSGDNCWKMLKVFEKTLVGCFDTDIREIQKALEIHNHCRIRRLKSFGHMVPGKTSAFRKVQASSCETQPAQDLPGASAARQAGCPKRFQKHR